MPDNPTDSVLENSVRDVASSYWHQTCTAKMGGNASTPSDAELRESTPGPVHVVEIVDHPGLLRRAPTQPLLRQLAAVVGIWCPVRISEGKPDSPFAPIVILD